MDEITVYELRVIANSDPSLEFINDLHATAPSAAEHASTWLAEHLGYHVDVKAILTSPNLRTGARFNENGDEVNWSASGASIKIRARLVKP